MHAFISTNWKPWPDHEDFCLQFTRLVHALEDAGGTIAECLMALGRIAPGNGEDWYRQLKILAEASEIRADVAFANGYYQTAESNWLGASAYPALTPLITLTRARGPGSGLPVATG